MTQRTVALEELKERRLGDVVREVVSEQEILTVRLPDGEEVRIQPVRRLEPLPKLQCVVPKRWKDAING